MDENLVFTYRFKLQDKEKVFTIVLDKENLQLVQEEKTSYPSWVLLEKYQCNICPLDKNEQQYCPMAKSLLEVVEFFKDSISYEKTDIIVETPTRNYSKNTSLQKGLSSLLGIYMVSCGCPITEKLRPVVRFHLPFATLEETKVRIISTYLLAQYLRVLKNKKPDWNLSELVKIYNRIKTVNESFCKRLSLVINKDANANAVIILNCFAESILFSLNKRILQKELGSIFKQYL